ncbi:hypothetical protein [Frigoriflavimonas asaccharolytica]|uniref:Uncharacterized protein n=1 Tax=Frigoriflavimonas asaccharolytica TaxID=2735899 RepID=A0A8J8K992_9FLAO|nr:hypothetical protein [Frigoriflavimonas asaccharolytica]NRS92837.1 hypothetical protein [Frigoriflavimonas asaccharolytica]
MAKGSSDDPCRSFSEFTHSTILPGVQAVNLDNGISTDCQNNILIFPTLQSYSEAISKLDDMIDDHNDNFDQLTANMTNEEADDYADEIRFDEDEPLTKFEDELGFCSLRKYLLVSEENWLSEQGDGSWNLNSNPNNYFIDDITERSLLSYRSEVIIGDCEIGFTLYKIFDWGYVSFPITNISETTIILTNLNNISNITMSPFNIDGAPIVPVQEVISNSSMADLVTTGGIGISGSGGGPSSPGGPSFSYDCNRFGKEKGIIPLKNWTTI